MQRRRTKAVLRAIAAWALLAASTAAPAITSGNDSTAVSERCAGYGGLISASLTTWEQGLGSWTVGRRQVANPATFDTPDWAPNSDLPDNRAGTAAFVPNLVSGDCGTDDEAGVLMLDSPAISIPGGAKVPRISIDHWFETEYGWDGGNLKISVNGGSFTLIPASAIEIATYTGQLFEPIDSLGFEYNTNPLANQDAFTRTIGAKPTGQWVQSRINLLGIAKGGDSIRVRFDFGVDSCTLSPDDAVGWYVDNVEVYHCEAELPPSNCGNGVINGPEQCDDGNNFIGDGCSNTCQVESGWVCEAPTSPANTISDAGFESGSPNPFWDEVSNTFVGTPICQASVCGTGGGSGAYAGNYWVWFGGIKSPFEGLVAQSIVIPTTVSRLTFQMEIPACDSAADYVEVLIDGNRELLINGASSLCGIDGYVTQSVDVSAYADNTAHDLEFHSETFAENGSVSNFFIDAVALPGDPSACRRQGTNLTLQKRVVNDDGGSAFPSAWTLEAIGPSGFSGTGPTVLSGAGFLPGTYDLSESGPAGYLAGPWVCTGGTQVDADTITIAEGQAASCTITNNDIAPTITVVNQVINDSGGPVTDPNAFGLRLDGAPIQHAVITPTDPGDHLVSQLGVAGYQPGQWGGNCAPDGSVTLALGQSATCTITNDDISPTLTVVKTIINDNGGSVTNPDAFGLKVDGNTILHNTPTLVNAGFHQLSEIGLAGYVGGPWGGNCAANGAVNLSLGQQATCTITNDDTAPGLTLVNQVVNNNGGNAQPSAWVLAASGPSPFSGPGPSISNGSNFKAGTYNLSVSGGPSGYTASNWVCVGGSQVDGDTITLGPGQNATCTITNNDTPPSLTLLKQVTNDNGGNAQPSAWTLFASGPSSFNGSGPSVSSGPTFIAGTYNLFESLGPSGYTPSAWVCTGGSQVDGDTITLALGQSATCTITNNDTPPSLTLVKQVVNNNGGNALASAWTLSASGPSPFSGAGPSVSNGPNFKAGTYDLSESGGPAGYTSGGWVCIGGSQIDGDTLTLAPGQSATCTITNNDAPPSLTLVKKVTNDNGGTANPSAWNLAASGPIPFSGPGPSVSSGSNFAAGTYNLSESVGPTGYIASAWSCVGGNQVDSDTITLTPGQNATCTITNNDAPSSLTLVKQVTNDDGGTAQPSAWTLAANGPTPLSGPGPNVSSGPNFKAGIYDLSESGGPSGYTASTWNCVGGSQNDADTITVLPGQAVTCTITNDDIGPGLTLVKQVINDDGGSALPSAWTLIATGPTTFSGRGPSVSSGPGLLAGTYVLSESGGASGYSAGAWVCVGGEQTDVDTINLEVGETAICTITNDDNAPQLTVVKSIKNDSGGGVTDPNAFGLKIDGVAVLSGVANTVSAGDHTVSEDGLPGYQAGSWGGDCLPSGFTSLALGESLTCTITNDDIPPTLTVVKTIINDNGGTVTDPNAFGLRIDGNPVLHNVPSTLSVGSHQVSEIGLAGYNPGVWGGNCSPDGTISLVLGQNAVCTITNDDAPPGLTLVKQVVNDNGGNAAPSAWTLTASGPSPFSGAGPSVSSGANFKAGTYNLSESGGPAGYTSGSWTCVGGSQVDGDTVTLAPGQNATCTLTNNDIPPSLTLVKQVTNDDGGSAQPSAWTLTALGPSTVSGKGPSVPSGPTLKAGSYDLSESGGPSGYTASAWVCSGGNQVDGDTVTLALGENATCTITNNDNLSSLTLVKQVVNDNGGGAQASAWNLAASGPSPFSGAGPSVSNGPGFKAGTYNLSENGGPSGYTASAWVCVGGSQVDGDTITVAPGQNASCTITNNDAAPSLTLVKKVTNNNGGTAQPSAWTLVASGPSPFSGSGPSVSNGTNFKAGSYNLSESGGPAGYTASNWVCVGGSQVDSDTVALAPGQSATCTITNDDALPSLTLIKEVINDNGGTASASAWQLSATGPTPFSGAGPRISSDASFKAGTYDLAESGGPAGYSQGTWNCAGGTQVDGNTITLAPGDVATCKLTNNDIAPSLTLVKQVTNNNGGEATPADWTLAAAGPSPFSGSGPSVSSATGFKAGTYNLSENGGPAAYTASDWNCTGGTQLDADTVALTVGQSATCTIVNDDDGPGLTLIKRVVNDNGGTAQASAWTLTADGPSGFSGSGPSVSNAPGFVAGTYVLSESTGPTGYSPGSWICEGGIQNGASITLNAGEAATCTITNDDVAPNLTLNKVVVNDNGGTAQPSAWTLIATGPTSISGPGTVGSTDVQSGPTFAAGTYTLSETGSTSGYAASSWSCVGGSQSGDQVSLKLGESATCTITNNDQPPSLTLIKQVTNDDGGTAVAADWTLTATGPTVLSGPGPSLTSGAGFKAGTYDLSESGGPPGYVATAWQCQGGSQGDADTITLQAGQTATCTITNDDAGPGLTLVKQVINDDGGKALPSAWTLTATGPTGFGGPGPSVSSGAGFIAGTYDLSESGGPEGYLASAWVCSGSTQDDPDTVTVELGESAICTITNNDVVQGDVIFGDGFELE